MVSKSCRKLIFKIVWVISEDGFKKLLDAHTPFAMECVHVRNPLAPKISWTNKIEIPMTIHAEVVYFSFFSVAIQHWTIASQGYLYDRIVDNREISVANSKKFLYSIQYLDFADQLATKGEISDFTISDDIRTKIHKKE
jgi:hypothetical protein